MMRFSPPNDNVTFYSNSEIIIRNQPISLIFFAPIGLFPATSLVFLERPLGEFLKGSEGPREIRVFNSSGLISSIMNTSSFFLEDSNSFCSFARVLSRNSSRLFFESFKSHRSLKMIWKRWSITRWHQSCENFTWRIDENTRRRNFGFEYLKHWQSALRVQSILGF